MFETIKDFFRKRALSKVASKTPTGFLPLDKISSASFMIDVEEPGFDQLREEILAWGRSAGVKVNIYFLDFRRIGKEELLLTSIQTTILKRDLNWLGHPVKSMMNDLMTDKTDLFVSMIDNGCPAVDFISKCANARFKIGRHRYEGHAFDLVVSGTPTEDLRSDSKLIFKAILDFLAKVK